jgi:NDP-sugar pyrophosphorylase family protein
LYWLADRNLGSARLAQALSLVATGGSTIIEHVLGALRQAGIGEMAISANGRTHDIMDSLGHHPSPDVTIHYNEDCLPRGAAGCIKDCEDWLGNETFIVVHGACLLLNVDFKHLIEEHRTGGAALTVAATSDEGRRHEGETNC